VKEDFVKYLASVGIVGSLLERISFIEEFYQHLCPDEITDIYVSEYMKEDGIREYENLWFFSEKYCMEAHSFVATSNFDIAPIVKKVSRIAIESNAYDFRKATEKSRLSIEIRLFEPSQDSMSASMKASKENCDNLMHILRKYFIPNFAE
jgi:hypothetical protein